MFWKHPSGLAMSRQSRCKFVWSPSFPWCFTPQWMFWHATTDHVQSPQCWAATPPCVNTWSRKAWDGYCAFSWHFHWPTRSSCGWSRSFNLLVRVPYRCLWVKGTKKKLLVKGKNKPKPAVPVGVFFLIHGQVTAAFLCCPLAYLYSYVCGSFIWAALVSLVQMLGFKRFKAKTVSKASIGQKANLLQKTSAFSP